MNDTVRQARRKATRTGCAVEATLSVLGGIWKPVLVFHLLQGRLRFNALCRLTPNATARMVTIQLRELEADGVVCRTVYPEVPPRVEYELSEFGRTLEPVLISLRDWGEALQARDQTEMARSCPPR
ncbi:helix-turn-helix domain-containing protein [Bosea sp. BIWAKO-01]|uniref:winged helix-turn-helix transcriptional regulator n=1 Tax=Bosea sp. BIWAKO-01 TaxID=506668 RepID=UPI0008539B9E|nr:helix-turn-helix domain-containing protein [Bosea sp. BIWAKO-01]GAU86101.1 transcriptional regulator of HxlR family [Bosea sp. BIWAKO-01]